MAQAVILYSHRIWPVEIRIGGFPCCNQGRHGEGIRLLPASMGCKVRSDVILLIGRQGGWTRLQKRELKLHSRAG
jgi:hypothetical protein